MRQETEHNVSVEEQSFHEKKSQKLVEELSQEKKNVEAMQSQLQQVSLKQATLQREKDEAELRLKQVCS